MDPLMQTLSRIKGIWPKCVVKVVNDKVNSVHIFHCKLELEDINKLQRLLGRPITVEHRQYSLMLYVN